MRAHSHETSPCEARGPRLVVSFDEKTCVFASKCTLRKHSNGQTEGILRYNNWRQGGWPSNLRGKLYPLYGLFAAVRRAPVRFMFIRHARSVISRVSDLTSLPSAPPPHSYELTLSPKPPVSWHGVPNKTCSTSVGRPLLALTIGIGLIACLYMPHSRM